ncbi:hypothetical protein VII00023_16270 [Vibrio ichthyoenteri ATCC 700023]|uniref:Uncharacterized protein n=1 Tax=Vibrio ichthyoenteri ATCC 700023 TaxID=870968 RepID=F9S0D4_9VIBR|nr:hypothetical protein [Vibrio ichthyoenteri]EGU43404.1 hypothetical protein VII00023_16270 [Vibrio ichthyoenteri ATCC 700023]
MTINTRFVYVPENEIPEQTQPSSPPLMSEKEAQRQALVKQAQHEGQLLSDD